MFAAFERESHRMEEAGQPLTADSLGELHYRLNQQYYGDGCVIDDCVRSEWMRIPHFYRAFYVYKYATGFSAAVGVLFGWAPARKASRLNPIDALRNI